MYVLLKKNRNWRSSILIGKRNESTRIQNRLKRLRWLLLIIYEMISMDDFWKLHLYLYFKHCLKIFGHSCGCERTEMRSLVAREWFRERITNASKWNVLFLLLSLFLLCYAAFLYSPHLHHLMYQKWLIIFIYKMIMFSHF